MERFSKDLREHEMKIIDYEKKKEMIPLTDKENKSYEVQKVCHICKNKFSDNDDDDGVFDHDNDDDDNKKTSKSKRSLPLHKKMQRSCS